MIWYNYRLWYRFPTAGTFIVSIGTLLVRYTLNQPFRWRHGPAGDSPRHLLTSSPPINASCVSKWAELGLPVQQKELQFNAHHLVRSRNAPHTTLGVRSRNTGPTRRGLEYSWSPGMHLAHVESHWNLKLDNIQYLFEYVLNLRNWIWDIQIE